MIVKLIILVSVVVVSFVQPVVAQRDPLILKFLEISPAVSKQTDVERLFGIGENGAATWYSIGDRSIRVKYSDGTCTADWLTPAGTVVEAAMKFKNYKPLSELTSSVSLHRLRVKKSMDVEGERYYFDDKSGIRYDVNEAQMVWMAIEVYPSNKHKKLRCKEE